MYVCEVPDWGWLPSQIGVVTTGGQLVRDVPCCITFSFLPSLPHMPVVTSLFIFLPIPVAPAVPMWFLYGTISLTRYSDCAEVRFLQQSSGRFLMMLSREEGRCPCLSARP